MLFVNVSELINANINFTIEDERTERSFGADGELLGVRHDMSNYFPMSYDREEELLLTEDDPEEYVNLVDDYEFNDDGQRWEHLADSHLHEREMQRAMYTCLDVHHRIWGEAEALANFRYQRFVRLSHFAESCASKGVLRDMAREVWKRYKRSVAICVARGEWSNLYLTKDQANSLMDYIKELLTR